MKADSRTELSQLAKSTRRQSLSMSRRVTSSTSGMQIVYKVASSVEEISSITSTTTSTTVTTNQGNMIPRSVDFLTALISVLHQSGCLCDFMLLVTQLAEGSFSPMNIAFLLCLERAKWQSLITTTQMRFRAVTKKFWLVVYRLLPLQQSVDN